MKAGRATAELVGRYRSPAARQFGPRAALLAATALAGALWSPQPGNAFDLLGSDATLPQPPSFNDAPFLNGAENVTNSGAFDATLSEGGGPAGTIYSGIISDGASRTAIVHTAGEVTFMGASTYTGGTTLYSGATLILGDDLALGTGGFLAFNGSTIGLLDGVDIANGLTVDILQNFDVGTGATGTYSGVITEFGDPTRLVKTGGGTLVLSNAGNDFNGGIDLRQGTLRFDSLGAIDTGTITFQGGILQAGAGGTLLNNSIFLDPAGGTFDTNGFDIQVDGPIGDTGLPTGQFIKDGAGTLTFNSDMSDYSTATLVAAGTLAGGATNVFSGNSAFTIAAPATLDLGGFDQTVASLAGAGIVTNGGASDARLTAGSDNNSTTFSGVVEDGATNTTALVKTGSGTLLLTGDNTYSGGTTIAGGTLQLGDGGLGGSITGDVLNNSVLAVNRSGMSSLLGDITGIGALVKSGTGQLILDGDNHYSGATDILDGSILSTDNFALSENSAFRVNTGAGLSLADGVDDAAIGSLADGPLGGGFVVLGFVDPFTFLEIGLDDKDTTFSGIITGAGSLQKTGTGIQTLTGVGSAIGGDLILCVCGGSGGLTIAGTFDAGGHIEMFDSALSVTLGGVLRQLDPNQGILIDTSTVRVSGAGSRLVAAGAIPMFDSDVSVTQGGVLSQLDPSQGIGIDNSTLQVLGAGSKIVAGGGVAIFDSDLSVTAGALLQQNQVPLSFGIFDVDFSDVLVSGAGSKIVAGGIVRFIESGLSVTAGGRFEQTAPFTAFGSFSIDSSDVLVTGAGSAILAQGITLIAGSTEDASLRILAGGAFDSRGIASLFGSAGVSTSVLVSGAGSLWTVGRDLLIGCPCGPATVSVADGGRLVVAGNTLNGPGSTLNLGLGGLSGTIVSKTIVNDGAIEADFTDTSTLAAPISGVGTLTKDGVGRLILSGNSLYTGATTVDGGILSVNGSIGSSGVTVNDGGTLGGTGTVGRTILTNNSTLAPGNSIGTLTVRNSLTFGSGSNYLVEVGTTADRTNVVAGAGPGNAVLSGGAVAADFQPGGNLTKRYVILNAAGGLGGTRFTGVTDDAPSILTSLSYDAGNVYLDNRLALGQLPGLTINQKNVADTITRYFDAKGTLPLAFATLDAAGLALASGELATGAMQSGFEASDRFLDVISDRFVHADGGSGGASADAGVTAYDEAGTAAADGAYVALLDKQASHDVAARRDSRWKVWGAAYGGASDIDGEGVVTGSHDLDTSVYGFAAGAGWREGDVGFGAALGGGHAEFDLDGGLGSGDEGLFNAGLHGRVEFGQAYLLGALAYGFHDVSTSRVVGADLLRSGYNAHSWSGRAEAGYRFDTAVMGLAPYAAFQGASLSIPSYGETAAGAGTFALDYDGRTATAARGELGIRLDRTVALDAGTLLKLTGRAAWAHSSDDDRSMTAAFQALPGTSFTVYGATPDRNSALLDLGAEFAFDNGLAASLAFQGQFGDNSRSYAGFGKLSFKW